MTKTELKAPYHGSIIIGDAELECAVLEDGTRVLSQRKFLRAIGRAPTTKAGTGGTVAELPSFLGATNLKSFIDKELRAASSLIRYKDQNGRRCLGYIANLLPAVCNVYLKARDMGALHKTQEHIAMRCDSLIRGLSEVGIIGLVDEATGYQHVRDREALLKILGMFISKELMKWQKRFPDEFYRQIFRLNNWQYKGKGFNPPQIVGKYINNIIYERLAPKVLDELRKLNPSGKKGRRPHKHHQWLTDGVGHPKLRDHLMGIIALMKAAPNWRAFKRMLERAYPKPGDPLPPFEDD